MRFHTGVEHALLREYLAARGLPASAATELAERESAPDDWRAWLDRPREQWVDSRDGIRPRHSAWGSATHALEDALARLCITYADTLPAGHPARESRKLREVELRTRLLLEIEWFDEERLSAHAVEYFASWVPYYECTLVVGRTDSPAIYHGHRQLALSAFGPGTHIFEGAREVLIGEWARFEGHRARFRRFGLIDGPMARAWAEQVG